MRNSHKTWFALCLVVAVTVASPTRGFARRSFPAPQTASNVDVPVVKGGSGSCTADFAVKDAGGKGVYDAKIEIQLKYGTLGLHKLDATVGTNSDGKARIEGLPEQIKKTAEFKITHGDQSKSLPFDPQSDCHPRIEVVLANK